MAGKTFTSMVPGGQIAGGRVEYVNEPKPEFPPLAEYIKAHPEVKEVHYRDPGGGSQHFIVWFDNPEPETCETCGQVL